jgi:hypothetical protein
MKKYSLITLVTLFIVSILLQIIPGGANAGTSGEDLSVQSIDADHPYSLFIPHVKTVGTETIFGVENYYFGPSQEMDYTVDLGAYWLRRNGVIWKDIEPSKGARNWSAMSSMENEFKYSAELGKKITLIIRSGPLWARLYPDSECGAIKDSEISSFANFMFDFVKRYSVPPYSVMYYEIWNEPEAPVTSDPSKYNYGCWGPNTASPFNDPNDPYLSARRMAQVLKKVYPKIKEANPNAQVLIGGMLMDCDPNNPPAGKDCRSSRFLEILFQEGAGSYFDIVSFHAYDYWNGGYTYNNTNWASSSNTNGPVVIAKTKYLRDVMSQYGYSEKGLMATEISLLCYSNCDTPSQDQTKAYYVAEAFAASIIQGLQAAHWYSQYDNWKENGLIAPGHNPYPAYNAYKFATQEMGSSRGGKDLSNGTFFIYEIYTPKGTLWLMWTKDGNTHTYDFGSNKPLGAKDVYGNSLNVSQQMQITVSPKYFEFYK